jgi:hypothetical protein
MAMIRETVASLAQPPLAMSRLVNCPSEGAAETINTAVTVRRAAAVKTASLCP